MENDPQATDRTNQPFREEVYRVVGFAIEIINTVGPGLDVETYENALIVELQAAGIPFVRKKTYPVLYKDFQIGEVAPVLVAHDCVLIEPMICERITHRDRARMMNMLNITGARVGLLVNFAQPRLEWERIVV